MSLGTRLLPVVSFHSAFFQMCFADKFLCEGKTKPCSRGLRCNISVNVYSHFYTSRVLTKIVLLLWAFSTNVPGNEFPGKTTPTQNSFQVSMRPLQLMQFCVCNCEHM